MMIYKASVDRFTKLTTVLCSLLIVGLPVVIFLNLEEDESYGVLAVPVILIVVMFVISRYRPIGYQVTPSEILILRPTGTVSLKRSEISTIEILPKERLKRSIRTFGVGGFFGYWGEFSNKQMGPMTWYVTRRDNPVLIQTTKGKKIIISPDEPEKFVATVNLT
ncbi:MAG: hypothetical protein IR153_01895 [Flavobacterium sp.]|nr:hypothetical protein [Flavobacterium sp.]